MQMQRLLTDRSVSLKLLPFNFTAIFYHTGILLSMGHIKIYIHAKLHKIRRGFPQAERRFPHKDIFHIYPSEED